MGYVCDLCIQFLQSERSNDMFCDDIFGDSPAGVRKTVFPFHLNNYLHTCLANLSMLPIIPYENFNTMVLMEI